jgi:hypothetical protein
MAKKKINKKNEPFEDAFNLFALIALNPIDKVARIKSYAVSITLVVILTTIWCIPVFFIGSVVSTTIGVFSMLIKLIKNKIYGNKKSI